MAVNGKESNWHDVTSRISQGSVLGPQHFVLYIHDLTDLTQSNTFLFADDMKIFRPIMNRDERTKGDNFMFQHVKKPTRGRGTNKSNLLDLILSNEEDNIDEIKYFSLLGKSDHSVTRFNILCNVAINNYTKKKKAFQHG